MSQQQNDIRDLFSQVMGKTAELESMLSAKQWANAIAVDKERLALLVQLSTSEGLEENSEQYKRFLQELFANLHQSKTEVENELSECRLEMGEFGQQRRASNLYRDISLTR